MIEVVGVLVNTADSENPCAEHVGKTVDDVCRADPGSDKVEGTTVYGMDDTARDDRQDRGKVAYAVTSFGGFLGTGGDYYPLPWSQLKYDTGLGGYRTNLTETQLKGAPKYSRSREWDWSDRSNDRKVYDYYIFVVR